MGYLLLEGGAEFGGRMRDAELRGIQRAGGFAAPIRIIPTAAAPDDNHERAGNNGAGTVTLYRAGRLETHEPGQAFSL